MKRTTVDKVRENLRLQQVYNVFLRYGWDLALGQWEVVADFRLHLQRWVWQLPEDIPEVSTPVKVRMMIEELGPTYVKMGQIVSSQSSVIPAEWEVELEKLQSDVPPFPLAQVRETIIEELGAPPEELYATFENTPLAAASTAQVHRATLHTGEQVVVKVQRPHIHKQMKADLGIMQNAARVASQRSEQLRSIDLVGMLDQFSTSVLDELDYGGEAYNALRLSKNMEGVEGVHIPTVYTDLSTSRVMTIEFIPGVKISDLEAIDAASLDRSELAKKALRGIIKQLLIDGFFHADPHPGNVLVNLIDGDVTFIDTGMVGELGLNARINLIQLIFAIQGADVTALGQILRGLSTPFVDDVDEEAYQRDFERKVGRLMYQEVVPFSQSVNVAFDLLREHGLRLDADLTMAIKAMMQGEAIATLLYPDGGIVNDGAPMVREMVMQQLDADKVVEAAKKQVIMTAREVFQRLPTLQEATLSWLDQYQKGRFEVHVDTSELSLEVTKLGRLGRMIVISVILVGMIIGSSIATSVLAVSDTEVVGRLWQFMYQLAYIGYVFAMVIAMVVVLRLVWRWVRGKDPAGD